MIDIVIVIGSFFFIIITIITVSLNTELSGHSDSD
jgi:biopolymer transport protein ExbD